MKGKTHSTEEIIRILRQADGGETAQSVCREHNISEQTFYRWKKKYGDMELADTKRLKLWIQLLSAPFGLCDKTKVNWYISFVYPHAPRRGAYEGVYSVDPPPKI